MKQEKPQKVKRDSGCTIVAEISANHGGNLKHAVSMIKEAKRCGADAVKFQVYTPDTLTINEKGKYFNIDHAEWGGQTLYQLYGRTYTPWSWFEKLKKVADEAGIIFFATAFDKSAFDLLESIGVPFHKIASFELVDLPLIEYAAGKNRPMILSTGMASMDEIREAVKAAKKGGSGDITLLKCVSSYPTDFSEMNLRTIPDMRKRFKCGVGLSDHTLGISAAVAAVALGAVMVEKHFTLSHKNKTPDSFFSLEPKELKSLVANIRSAEKALGDIRYGITRGEQKSRVFRRSLFVVQDVKKGDIFSRYNVRSIRPGYGLAPKDMKYIIGKSARRSIKRGTPLRRDHIQ